MALKSWLASLKSDVTDGTPVQAPIHVGLRCNGIEAAGVTAVIDRSGSEVIETAVTALKIKTLQPKPAWALGRTLVTDVTVKKLNAQADATYALHESDLLKGWTVTIPMDTTVATMAKFRAASLALDASIIAAAGSQPLLGEPPELTVSAISTTTTTARPDAPRLFRRRGPWLTVTQQSAAQAYLAHHFNCRTCIAAGRGIRYGRRCAVGRALWNGYTGVDNLQTEGEQS